MTNPDIPIDWRELASCGNSAAADLWYPETGKQAKAAKEICEGCEVRLRCGENAVRTNERGGIRAGFHTGRTNGWNALKAWLKTEAKNRDAQMANAS